MVIAILLANGAVLRLLVTVDRVIANGGKTLVIIIPKVWSSRITSEG